jgi:hypothetical protein
MPDVFGNTLGLKPSQLHALQRTFRRRVDADQVVSPELARHLAEISRETGRQVGVLLDRKGEVEWVVVGDARKLTLPDVGRARAGSHRLRGLRLVHTHLDGEPLTRDDQTDLALLRLDSVTAVEVAPSSRGREMLSIDLSEYADPLPMRTIRIPYSGYLKPWQQTHAVGAGNLPRIGPIIFVTLDAAESKTETRGPIAEVRCMFTSD